MNTQDWFHFRWTGWMFLQFKGLLTSSPVPKFKSINSSALSCHHSPTLTSIHDNWKNHRCSSHISWMILAAHLILLNPFNFSSPHPKFHHVSGFLMPSPWNAKETEYGHRGLREDVSSDATETGKHIFCPTQYYIWGEIKITCFRKPSKYRKKQWRHREKTHCSPANMYGKNNKLFLPSTSKT